MKVYVAGPLTVGSEMHNVRVAIEAAETLLRRGYSPYVPHLNVLWHLIFPHGYEAWMSLDFAYLEVCDALLRLPGESPGADREVAFAKRRGMRVEYNIEAFTPL